LKIKEAEMAGNTTRGAGSRRSGFLLLEVVKWLCILMIPLVIIGGGLVYKRYAEFRKQMPSLDGLDKKLDVATRVIDRNELLIGEIGTKRRVVAYRDLPPLFVDAVTAAEDQRFWTHGGVDFRGVARAFISGLKHFPHFRQGASTITQQVVKNYLGCSSTKRDWACKIVEMMVAWEIESRYTKEQIMTMYLNKISYGFDHYGIDAGARFIFGQPVKELSLAKLAMLAGLPQSPEKKSPLKNPKAAKDRQEHVLGRMLTLGMITEAEYDKAKAEKLVFVSERAPEAVTGQEVLDHVRKYLIGKYGTMERINQLGLTIQVSIDIKLQAEVKKALEDGAMAIAIRHGRTYAPQGTAIMLDSASGEVLAMVGGIPYKAGGLNHAFAPRAPGSVMKLFVYTAAVESGKSMSALYRDEKDCYEERGKPLWCPGNYSGERSEVPDVPPITAFAHSYNTIAVKLMCGAPSAGVETGTEENYVIDEKTGERSVLRPLKYCKENGLIKPTIRIARELGIKSDLDPEPSLVLGTSPIKPMEIAAAYATLANNGRFVEPTIIIKITGENAPEPPVREARQALDPETASVMRQFLRAVATQGTARAAEGRLTEDVFGKTGTAADFSDAWFAGFAGHITGVVQYGYEKANGPRGQKLGNKETGASAALPVWLEMMSLGLTGKSVGTVKNMSRRMVEEKVVAEPGEPESQDDGSASANAVDQPAQAQEPVANGADDNGNEGSGTVVPDIGNKVVPGNAAPSADDGDEGSGTVVP
jgi:penicillin-binding protein 1A